MLDELMEFEQIPKKAPKIYKKKPSYKRVLSNPKPYLLEISKEEIEEEPIITPIKNIHMNRRLSVGEKIFLIKKKQLEKKRRAEMYKELNKNKKMNLHQFLTRMQNYEQKKKYNLELKKYQQLQKETESIQEKPKLSYNTLKICKTLAKEPLYKRTNVVMEEHEQEMKNLTTFYSFPKEVREKYLNETNNTTNSNKLNKSNNKLHKSKKFNARNFSAESTRNNNTSIFKTLQTIKNSNEKKKNQPRKITKKQIDDFFEKQENWLKNKAVSNQYFEKFYQIQNDTYSDMTFRPFISQASLEILDIKNRLNVNNDEFYKYKIPNTNSYNDYNNYILNKGRTIYDKLYDEAFQKKDCFEEQIIKYNYNIRQRDRFRNIPSKFFDIYKNKSDNALNNNQRNKYNSFDDKQNKFKKIKGKMVNKSYDDKYKIKNLNNLNNKNASMGNLKKKKKSYKRRSFFEYSDANEYNYFKMKKEKEKYHWRNSLLKIKPLYSEPNDFTYHLNIMQTGAWNDNYVNKITLNENSKCKSVINLVNEY